MKREWDWKDYLLLSASCLTALAGWSAVLVVNWPEGVARRFGVSGLAASVVLFALWLTFGKATAGFRGRFHGIDLRFHHFLLRPIFAVVGSAWRAVFRVIGSGSLRFYTSTALVACGGAILFLSYLKFILGFSPEQNAWQVYGYAGCAAWFVWYLLISFASRLQELLHGEIRQAGIKRVVWTIAEGWQVDDVNALDWAEIIRNDPGPICLYSVNFYRLIDPEGVGTPTLLDEVWQTSPKKKFRWLVTDPTTPRMRRRARRLNGAYKSFYLRRFLLVLFRWYKEQNNPSPEGPRIELKSRRPRPPYRLLCSAHRAIVQRYSWLRMPPRLPPHMFYRVIRLSEVEDRMLEAMTAVEEGSDDQKKDPSLDEALTYLARGETQVRGDYPSMYAHFQLSVFENAWLGASAERFIDDWNPQRLYDFARSCGISKRKLRDFDGDTQRTVKEICTVLDLTTQLNAARNSKLRSPPKHPAPPTQPPGVSRAAD